MNALLITLIFYVLYVKSSFLLEPSSLSRHMITNRWEGLLTPSHFNITAELVFAEPETACDKIHSNFGGKVVIAFYGDCSYGTKLKNLWEANAGAAMIVVNSDGTVPRNLKTDLLANHLFTGANAYWDDVSNVDIPTVWMKKRDGDFLKSHKDKSLVVSVTPDTNEWKQFCKSGGFITLQVLYSVATVLVIAIAGRKYYLYARVQGIQPSLPQGVMALQLLENLFRFFYVVLDPWWAGRGVFYTQLSWSVMLTISYPFSLASTLLIAFHWVRLIKSSTKLNLETGLGKLKIPLAILVAVAGTCDFITAVLRGIYFSEHQAEQASMGLYLIEYFATFQFFQITGLRILWILRRMKTVITDSQRGAAIRRITLLVVLSSIGMEIFVSGMAWVLWGSWNYFYTPGAGFIMQYIGLWLVSITQVLTFEDPQRDSELTSETPSSKRSQSVVAV